MKALFRVVQLDLTLKIELFYLLFEICHCENRKDTWWSSNKHTSGVKSSRTTPYMSMFPSSHAYLKNLWGHLVGQGAKVCLLSCFGSWRCAAHRDHTLPSHIFVFSVVCVGWCMFLFHLARAFIMPRKTPSRMDRITFPRRRHSPPFPLGSVLYVLGNQLH